MAVSAPPVASPVAAPYSLDLLKESRSGKLRFLFYGETGNGKSVQLCELVRLLSHQFTGLNWPNADCRMLIITFDGQTKDVKEGLFNDDPNIYVVDGMALYNAQPEEYAKSGYASVGFVEWLLDTVVPTFHPHIIAFDGLEKLNRLGDGKMRALHGLRPSQGFAERAFWKDRNLAIDAIVRKAEAKALFGVAYTVYYAKTFADEGSITTRDKTPAYIDAVHGMITLSMECRGAYDQSFHGNTYQAYIQLARPNIRDITVSGITADVTWRYDPQTQRWTPKSFPYGPGLVERFRRVALKYKDLKVIYPEETTLTPDELRAQHRYIDPVNVDTLPAGVPTPAAYAAPPAPPAAPATPAPGSPPQAPRSPPPESDLNF